MPRELRPLARALGLRPATVGGRAGWRGAHIVLGVVGVGTRSSGASCARILDQLQPSRVVVVGLAGAVDSDLSIADVIAPASVVHATTGATYTPHARTEDAPFSDGAGDAAVGRPRRRILVTVDRFGDALPDGASAVDMETAAIAAECERRDIPWDVRRAISDLPGTLHATVVSVLGSDGRPDPLAVARLLARDPRQAAVLVRLARDSSRAVGAVTRLVAAGLRGTPG